MKPTTPPIPKKLNNCPLVDCSVDIRFKPTIDDNAVFGFVLQAVRERFGAPEKLPINQLPETVIQSNDELNFQPRFRMKLKSDPNLILQVGPKSIVMSSSPLYVGWSKFIDYLKSVIEPVENLHIADDVIRVGIRYINFFKDKDIFQGGTNVVLMNGDDVIPCKNANIRYEKAVDGLVSTVMINNNSNLNITAPNATGSVIDIDTCSQNLKFRIKDLESFLNSAHDQEHRIFYSLLSKSLLESLDPKYE